jgi:hypothetical protein
LEGEQGVCSEGEQGACLVDRETLPFTLLSLFTLRSDFFCILGTPGGETLSGPLEVGLFFKERIALSILQDR